MSEQQPLLPSHSSSPGDDAPDKSTYEKCQQKTAYYLEHPTLHKIVILLIAIDAACVLADLAYSFLSPTCAPPGEDSPEWLEILSHISLAITTLFLVEIPLTLWALGVEYLNPFGPIPHAGLHLFDSIIILTTFILEAILRGKEQELAGLLVVLRLWRLVKLVGGVAVGTSEIEEENAERLAETQKELEEVKRQLYEVIEENARLKAQLQT
ncbi:hypothetical protein BDN70DRAFT_850896 [Pholiota conissans]|uniref:Voltage-gated hydrogen channel 1 n=1 Tax=Pholiota conissans TaxID=109636 RepID=A0A9P6D5Q7_9AGAR|nr:hypothetical protein BDN70DRAFT_850896 [Pholiota conissans]